MKIRAILVTAALAGLLGCLHAQAGGIGLYEQGDPASGAAHAGQSALALDASTVYLNPAGMSRLDTVEFLAGLQGVLIDLEFDPTMATTTVGSDGGQAGVALPGGGFYVVYPFSDDVRLGLSFTGPFGAGLDYGDDWVGRYFVEEVTLLVFDLQPSASLRVNEWLSIGGGVNLQYSNLDMDVGVNRLRMSEPDGKINLDLDDFAVGFSAGVLVEPMKGTRFGVKYRSQVTHDLDGSIDTAIGYSTSINSSLVLPHGLNFSVYHELDEQWAIMGDFGWANWSSMEYTPLTIELGDRPVTGEIPRNFDDTWRLGGGVHYRPNADWLFQGGISYDSSPVGRSDRLPDMPVDEQWRFSVGAQYEFQRNWKAGVTYTFINAGDNAIDNQLGPLSGRLAGEFDDNFIHVIGLYLDVRK